MNIHSSLIAELRDKSYRDAYVASQIKIGLPFQVRALRQSRDLTQGELAELAGMTQPRIAEIEKAGKRSFNLETLLRIASALDVGLEVRFVPISEIINHDDAFDPDNFSVRSFVEELQDAERDDVRSRLVESLNTADLQAQRRAVADDHADTLLRLIMSNKSEAQNHAGREAIAQLPLNYGWEPRLVEGSNEITGPIRELGNKYLAAAAADPSFNLEKSVQLTPVELYGRTDYPYDGAAQHRHASGY